MKQSNLLVATRDCIAYELDDVKSLKTHYVKKGTVAIFIKEETRPVRRQRSSVLCWNTQLYINEKFLWVQNSKFETL